MIKIEFEGFVAGIELGKDDYLRGTVRDTHEHIHVRGLTIHELRSDFAQKIAVYKERCAKRGIQPFNTFEGRSTVEIDELNAQSEAGELSEEHPLGEHRHSFFFRAKANNMIDHMIELRDGEFKDVPPHLRLPIDDIVDELRRRTRSPRVSNAWKVPEKAKHLNVYIRARLSERFHIVSLVDPSERHRKLAYNESFIKYARQLQANSDELLFSFRDLYTALLPIFGRGFDQETYSHRYEVVRLTEQYLLGLSGRLSEMISWAYDELDDIAPPRGGRPRLSWRYDFIAGLADLWRVITDREPSYKPDGLFTRFVEAAWQSGGDDMPEVPWDHVVQRYPREGKERGGKTSPSGD